MTNKPAPELAKPVVYGRLFHAHCLQDTTGAAGFGVFKE